MVNLLGRFGWCCLALSLTNLQAKDFWETKAYTAWSEKECKKILTKSPWAFKNSFRRVAYIGSTLTGERETTEILEFRLLTAKLIRMAFARLQLLQNPGDEAVAQQVRRYVDSDPGDQVVVQISYRVVPAASGNLQALHTLFGHATLATFHGNTMLISSDGVTVPIAAYLPWGPQRPNPAFVFKRFDDTGKPYFSGKEKSIMLRSEFSTDATENRVTGLPQVNPRRYRISVRMKPKDLFYREEFAF